MKKTLWTVMIGMLLVLTSCQNENDFTSTSSGLPQTQEVKSSHFYGVKSVKDTLVTRGIAQRNKLWSNGTSITVKFLNDPYNMAGKIRTYATEWEKHANIKFDFVTSGNADVRIGFDWKSSKYVTWSYTGNDCKYIKDQNEATVNFAYWDTANEEEKRADVLRAFGQVLGLELEHRHLSFNPGWTSSIAEYWEGEIEDIPWSELQEYVLKPIENTNLVQTAEYDKNSIMIWPFSRRYATNTARDFNYTLSDNDIEFIKQLYPKTGSLKLMGMIRYNYSDYSRSGFKNFTAFNLPDFKGDLTVDWGNDKQSNYSDQKFIGSPVYSAYPKDYLISITGNLANIKSIKADTYGYPNTGNYSPIDIVDISGCPELEEIDLEMMTFFPNVVNTIDFSKNYKLKKILMPTYSYDNIDVSNNRELTHLRIGQRKSSRLNTSNNPKLEELQVWGGVKGGVQSADLTKNINLTFLELGGPELTSIDLSQNTKLKKLTIFSDKLSTLDLSKNVNLTNLDIRCKELTFLNLSNNTNLTMIYFYDAAFLLNQQAAINFANTLPNNTGKAAGTLNIGGGGPYKEVLNWIKGICDAKNWKLAA